MAIPVGALTMPKMDAEGQSTAARFRLAYLAHLELAGVAAGAGLHAHALATLRFAIECFFKCVYQCAINAAFDPAIWSDERLKPFTAPAGQKTSSMTWTRSPASSAI